MFGLNQVPPTQSIRTIVKVFGSLFSDISISQPQGTAPSVLIKVPLEFGSKQKWYVENTADPNKGIVDNSNPILNQNPFERQFPRMVYSLENMQYDPKRKLAATLQNVSKNGGSLTDDLVQYIPVPWTFTFLLTIGTKNLTESWQIIEQIVPYFQPHLSVSVDYYDATNGPIMNQSYQSQVLLINPPEFDVDWEGDYNKMRKVEASMSFRFNGYIFLPTTNGKLITNVTVKYDPYETDQITSTTHTLTPQ
jgi:hypothetical protein